MKKLFEKSGKEFYILGGILIFVFGMILGTTLSYGKLANIEGFLFNKSYAYATDSDATSSNATSSNATCSNATSGDATSSNATSGNATCSNATSSNLNYNDLYLSSVHVFGCGPVDKEDDSDGAAKGCYVELKSGNTIPLVLETTGDGTFVKALVYFEGNKGDKFSVEYYPGNSQTKSLIVPSYLTDDTYDIVGILLTGRNYDTSTFTKYYGESGLTYKFNKSGDHGFKFIKSTTNNGTTKTETVKLNSISLKSSKANINDKVYVNYSASETLSSLKLTFSNKTSTFSVNVIIPSNEDPYFKIPSNVGAGEYSLTNAVLKTSDSSITYSNTKNSSSTYYNFNISLTVEEKNNTGSLVFNNEDIDSKIISQIYKADNNSEIYVNANNDTLLVGDIFNAIKGTTKKLIINTNDNQIVFNGNDITNGKTIDAKIEILNANQDEEISSLINTGFVIKFTSNGDLPGKATVRIKSTDAIKNAINNSGYVYYYNETDKKFLLISDNLKLTDDGYYEFTISHNSKYLLSKDKLNDDLVSTTPIVVNNNDSNETVSFQRGNKTNLILIGVGAIVCAVIVIVIIVLKSSKNKEEKSSN